MASGKKIILGIVIVCVVLAGGYLLYSQFIKKTPVANPEAEQNSLSSQLAKACDILTEDVAKTALNGSVTRGDEVSSATSSSDDIAVSQCSYTQSISPGQTVSPDSLKSVNLLVRSARTDTGKQANSDVFSEGKMPSNAEALSGYGEKAFWNPEFGQLNILKNGNWYIVEFGSTVPSIRSLSDTKDFANTLANKL